MTIEELKGQDLTLTAIAARKGVKIANLMPRSIGKGKYNVIDPIFYKGKWIYLTHQLNEMFIGEKTSVISVFHYLGYKPEKFSPKGGHLSKDQFEFLRSFTPTYSSYFTLDQIRSIISKRSKPSASIFRFEEELLRVDNIFDKAASMNLDLTSIANDVPEQPAQHLREIINTLDEERLLNNTGEPLIDNSRKPNPKDFTSITVTTIMGAGEKKYTFPHGEVTKDTTGYIITTDIGIFEFPFVNVVQVARTPN